jgi:hypothetical protein
MRNIASGLTKCFAEEEAMQWCLIGLALALALLGMALLKMRLRAPRVRPGLLLRGCAALACLMVAAMLAGLALWAGVVAR